MVHWKGYPNEEDTWEPASTLTQDAPDLVAKYHKDNPGAPRPLTRIQFAAIPFKPIPESLTQMDISYPDGLYLENPACVQENTP